MQISKETMSFDDYQAFNAMWRKRMFSDKNHSSKYSSIQDYFVDNLYVGAPLVSLFRNAKFVVDGYAYESAVSLHEQKYNTQKIIRYIQRFFEKLKIKCRYHYDDDLKTNTMVYTENDWCFMLRTLYQTCELSITGPKEIVDYFNNKFIPNIKKYCVLDKENKASIVNVIAKNNHGMYLQDLRYNGVDFQPQNYTKEVVEEYQSVCQIINERDFSGGRLFVLSGPPGTGKTYIVRSLIKELDSMNIIIMEPAMLNQITGPDFMGFLTQLKDKDIYDRVLIVVEDGERCLVSRNDAGGSDGFITTMLNLSDGIIGDGFDISLLITTNQVSNNFDDAIKRSGRCNKSIEIPKLSKEQANKLLKELTPEGESREEFTDDAVLADVYARARNYENKSSALEGLQETRIKGFFD